MLEFRCPDRLRRPLAELVRTFALFKWSLGIVRWLGKIEKLKSAVPTVV
jgi:hypothetical protein